MANDGGGNAKDRIFTAETLDPKEYKRWKQWAKARLRRSSLKPEDRGPLLFTFLDGVAQMMFDDDDVEAELAVEGGENVIFQRLDARYPDAEPSDKLAEALDMIYDLKWETGETSTNFVGRNVQVFARAAQEGVRYPPEAQGHAHLRGARLEATDRAVVLAAASRQWSIDKLASALSRESLISPA